MWQIPKSSFKWGIIGRSMDHFVIKALNINHFFVLGPWLLLIITPQMLNWCFVHYFCLLIYMWMEIYGSFQLGVYLLANCSPKGFENSIISVWDDAPWYLKVGKFLRKKYKFHFQRRRFFWILPCEFFCHRLVVRQGIKHHWKEYNLSLPKNPNFSAILGEKKYQTKGISFNPFRATYKPIPYVKNTILWQ